MVLLLAISLLGVGGLYFWFTRLPSAQQLNLVNNLTPGDGAARLAVRGQIFSPDHRLALNIWRPAPTASVDDGKRPVILFAYGGSWRSGARDDYDFAGRAFAAQGFVTVVSDYRLFPGVTFPGFVEDVAAATAWTHDNIARFGGDPERIVLVGHSAGGYNIAMVALDPQWLGRHGKRPGIIKGFVPIAAPIDFYPFDSDSTRDAFGSYHRPQATQPLNFVRNGAPPALILTGLRDTTVRPRNSKLLSAALNAEGNQATLKTYAAMDHYDIIMALSKPFRSKGPVLGDISAFARQVTER
jgi:acetyl esterase/lipase